ncbi:hypothetical protein GCM10025868_23500 [Angustibacter aerolatus]|uniref:Berberine/berberine-like domain-containing protein n=1 Tax=Angustibacter aerolatus TaxID=1162965 RepID=A0ABQ6JJX7_9ACTN|nr:BBE domain-containing protein [Angustibacter aerolatus]GMA87100.1 hypothetical protein GCM10025868_23500 [Angustibacter aerolatus]
MDGLVEGGASLDALGGAVRDVGADDTAFAHRDALATVQYTATWADGGAEATPYDRFVRGLRRTMQPAWGDGAYVNYADPSLDDPARAYFGDHAERLHRVRTEVDPHGLLSQPQAP